MNDSGFVWDKSGAMRRACLVLRETTHTPTPLLVPASRPAAKPAHKRPAGAWIGGHGPGGPVIRREAGGGSVSAMP